MVDVPWNSSNQPNQKLFGYYFLWLSSLADNYSSICVRISTEQNDLTINKSDVWANANIINICHINPSSTFSDVKLNLMFFFSFFNWISNCIWRARDCILFLSYFSFLQWFLWLNCWVKWYMYVINYCSKTYFVGDFWRTPTASLKMGKT